MQFSFGKRVSDNRVGKRLAMRIFDKLRSKIVVNACGNYFFKKPGKIGSEKPVTHT
jgi:hypothetical protein